MKHLFYTTIFLLFLFAYTTGATEVPSEHPYLLGNRSELKQLAKQKPAEYQRVKQVAKNTSADDYSRMISMGLVSAIEEDRAIAEQAKQMTLKYINGPIKKGHTPFAYDLALCGLVYDLCYEVWNDSEKQKFHAYLNNTYDANINSETHVFHNGWYGYKNWGIGIAAYSCYHDNKRAPELIAAIEKEFRQRAAPALELAGAGGGWAEGYYINYWIYEWLFFCEVARRCSGTDYYAMAPSFFSNRAIASMFEMYPGIKEYGSRRPIPMGDGGGRLFGGDRDKALSARRILVNYYRNDPAHQAVHTFNETTPRSSVGNYAYKDFLWRDTTVKGGDLKNFKLSHLSQGAGYIYARSSWDDDATYFFFKCGDRFTAHQHLDVGHFLIYKYEELVGDGGHYDDFGSIHDVNYHLRTIAHNTILVFDQGEKWHNIRAGKVTSNDGGQHHNWQHHNGAVADAQEWFKDKNSYDIADIVAFEDKGSFLYVAGDCTRAYSSNKLELFTRQIVYIRPDTFIIFDRVKTKNPTFKTVWLLQAIKKPEYAPPDYIITNGKGRLFLQPILPETRNVSLVSAEDLYVIDGIKYLPKRDTGAAPECRIEISPSKPTDFNIFLNVLTAGDSQTKPPPVPLVKTAQDNVSLMVNEKLKIEFSVKTVDGSITINGKQYSFPKTIVN